MPPLLERREAAAHAPARPALVLARDAGSASDGLVASGLCKRLRSGRKWTEVLRDLDLQAPGGAVVWVGGRNGVGKTTLLRVLSGILLPDDGSVRALGVDARADRRTYQRRVGFLSAGDRGLYARLAVGRQLEYWARIAFVPRAERQDVVAAAVEDFVLEPLMNRRVERLSLGQRQRVRLALAFLHRPYIALLDEPANSLDDEGVAALRRATAAVTSRGGVVVWCSPPGDRDLIDSHLGFELQNGRLARA
jgi:ABC-2 type transport system ATP-binding protein